MLRFFLAGVLLLSFCSHASAQKIGDSQEAVTAALGEPRMSMGSSEGLIWVFEGNVRVTFKDRTVVAIEGLQEPKPVDSKQAAASSPTVVPASNTPVQAAAASASTDEVEAEEDEPTSASESRSTSGGSLPPWQVGGVLFVFVGAVIVSLVCQAMILIKAFQAGIWWGLGSLFVPCVILIFIVSNWSDVKKPFLVNLATVAAVPVFIFLT